MKMIAEIEVENILSDEPTCGRPCCAPKYTIQILGGQKLDIPKEAAQAIIQKFAENPWQRPNRVFLSLVLE